MFYDYIEFLLRNILVFRVLLRVSICLVNFSYVNKLYFVLYDDLRDLICIYRE